MAARLRALAQINTGAGRIDDGAEFDCEEQLAKRLVMDGVAEWASVPPVIVDDPKWVAPAARTVVEMFDISLPETKNPAPR